MPVLVGAAQLSSPPQVTVSYHHVAADVTSARVLSWRDLMPVAGPDTTGSSSSGSVRVACAPGVEVAVLFVRDGGAYAVDGPFVCPSRDAERSSDSRWRRTLTLRAPPNPSVPEAATWISGVVEHEDAWPRCIWRTSVVECWGIPVDGRGVLAVTAGERVWWATVTAQGSRELRSSAWARMVIVSSASPLNSISATIARPVPPREERPFARRLETALVPDAHAVRVGPASLWVFGEDVPPSSWVELRAAGLGPQFVALDEVAHGPPALPFWTTLEDAHAVHGAARGAQEEVAAGAVVTLFRLLDPAPSHQEDREQPRRVFVGEHIADNAGAFEFDGLGEEDYEIVAWHPQLGRGIAAVPRGGGSLIVRLESAGQVRGRVVADGKPLAGIDIMSVPDMQAFAQAADLTDVKGGDTRSGADGRFVVSTAPAGGGEVRVGGGTYPIRRFPLPRTPIPIIDLGDIELGASIDLTIALNQDPGCDLRAVGPVDRTGLQVIAGTRTAPGVFRLTLPEEGLWDVRLVCGRNERAPTPPVITVTRESAGKEVQLLVR